MDVADTKELPREMSAADVAEETKADVEAVKSVEDASYPTTASRELSHTKPSFAADADRGPGERAFYAFGKHVVGKRPWASSGPNYLLFSDVDRLADAL